MSEQELWDLAIESIRSLETERGILASAREEIYGCVFGRDSLITALGLLRAYEKAEGPKTDEVYNEYFLALVRKILSNLCDLQGTRVVIDSGEEPGKCIHEFRPTGHEHLTKQGFSPAKHPSEQPWYLYPDDVMRNYDTVDATPLLLMAFYEYVRVSGDWRFAEEHMANIMAALIWVLEYGDTNNDGFIDYRFHPDRTSGGLRAQSWMDSTESLFFEDSADEPAYPIAPVEVQAYAWVALRAWGVLLAGRDAALAERLAARAAALKEKFNTAFVLRRNGLISLAFAIDGKGRALTSARSSMGHCLWAVYRDENGNAESVVNAELVPHIVRRVLSRDLFVPQAGIRTLSSRSKHYDPVSYHNGSIWPHDTAMLSEGLDAFGFSTEAHQIRAALLRAYAHFKTPIELFAYSGGKFREYQTSQGGKACRVQAWSAASLLATLREYQNYSVEYQHDALSN